MRISRNFVPIFTTFFGGHVWWGLKNDPKVYAPLWNPTEMTLFLINRHMTPFIIAIRANRVQPQKIILFIVFLWSPMCTTLVNVSVKEKVCTLIQHCNILGACLRSVSALLQCALLCFCLLFITCHN